MSKPRRCTFIQSRACPIDVDEIPLDVCRLCIDAWKTSAEIQALTGSQVAPQTIMVQRQAPLAQQLVMPGAVESEPVPPKIELPKKSDKDTESYACLHELDSKFINDKIDADEYVRKRRAIVGQLSNVKKVGAPSDGFTTIDLNDDLEISLEPDSEIYKMLLPLVLIERKKSGFSTLRYPLDTDLPGTLTDNKIKSIYNLYERLDKGKIVIQFDGTKLGLLGKKNNRLLCIVLEADEKLEEYDREIKHLTELFQETDDLENLVKALQKAMESTKTFSHLRS